MIGNIPKGQMSPLAGLELVLLALALLMRFPLAAEGKRLQVRISDLLAVACLAVACGVAISYAGNRPWFYGSSIVPMAHWTSITFMALCLSLLLLRRLPVSPVSSAPDAADVVRLQPSVFGRTALAVFAIVACGIGALAAWYVRNIQSQSRWEARQVLHAVGDLKRTQVTQWRNDLLADARYLAQAGLDQPAVHRFLRQPAPKWRSDVIQTLVGLGAGERYSLVALLDAGSTIRMVVPEQAVPPRVSPDLIERVRATGYPVVSAWHREGSAAYLDIYVPVPAPASAAKAPRPFGFALLRVLPCHTLFPLLQSWPVHSSSGETILVRRQGASWMFINNMPRPNGRSPLGAPVTPRNNSPSGPDWAGLVETSDDRGVPVVGAVRAIPDSDWYVIAKIDRDEIYGSSRRHARLALGLTLALAGLAGLATLLISQRREASGARRMLEAERLRLALAKRYEHLMQSANDIILMVDQQDRILEANARALAAYGYSLSELQTMKRTDLRTPESHACAVAHPEMFGLGNPSIIFETMHRRKDGSTFPVEVSGQTLEIDGSRYGVGIIRDITLRKAHEREIERLNRLYATLSAVNHCILRARSRTDLFEEVCRIARKHARFEFVWIGWLDPNTRTLRPVAHAGNCGEGFYDLRVPTDDVPGRGPAGTCVAKERECIINSFLDAPTGAQWRNFALERSLRAVAALPIYFNAAVCGSVSIYSAEEGTFEDKEIALLKEMAMDISRALEYLDNEEKRWRAEESLRASEERFQLAIRGANDGLWDWDLSSGRVYYSPRWKSMLGYAEDEITDTVETWRSLVPPQQLARVWAVVQDVLSGKAEKFEIEYQMRHKDGHFVDILSRGVLVDRNNGEAPRMVGTHVDLTERKAAELALRESQTALQSFYDSSSFMMGLAQLDEQFYVLHGNAAALGYFGADRFPSYKDQPASEEVLAMWVQACRRSRREQAPVRFEFESATMPRQRWVAATVAFLGESSLGKERFSFVAEDVTERKHTEQEREITMRLLRLINESPGLDALLQSAIETLRDWFRCDAAAIRLRRGEDYPYIATSGFSAEFVQAENSVCLRDADGRLERDGDGHPRLDCICGHVLSGRLQGQQLAGRGAFCTNSTTDFLAGGVKARARGYLRCNAEGYESMALVPLRVGTNLYGLLQINNRAKGWFGPEAIALLERLADTLSIAIAHGIGKQEVRESEERYRRIVETASEGIWTVDCDGNTKFANPAMARMLGYAPEEMMGRNVRDFLFDQDVHAESRQADESTFSGDARQERRFRRKDGSECWCLVSTRPLQNASSGFDGTLGMFSDITERRLLEEQLLHSQKMEAIGALAGGVAHDFNNLLTVIVGYSDMLLEDLPPDDASRSVVENIRHAGRRATSLTRQLLAFSRKQVLDPRVLNLNDIIGGVEKMLRPLIGEDVVLTTLLSPEVSRVKVDPGQMEQVIMNLAVNARDAMPGGGRFTIETRDFELGPEYCRLHPARKPGRYVLLALSDTGCGMTPEVRSRIFEPFFTTKGPGRGTGLGLSTVFGIVKQSEGYIDVTSAPGAGTSFYIYLPAVDAGAGAAFSRDGGASCRGTETILLVEDEDEVRRLASHVLQAHGYRVLEASGGDGAIAALDEKSGEIDLLLTDVVMPGMSGPQLAEALRARHPELRVLFMSGYADDKVIRQETMQLRTDYMNKPFSALELASKVREILDSARFAA
jgi:PAS domain S-box-containing protein